MVDNSNTANATRNRVTQLWLTVVVMIALTIPIVDGRTFLKLPIESRPTRPQEGPHEDVLTTPSYSPPTPTQTEDPTSTVPPSSLVDIEFTFNRWCHRHHKRYASHTERRKRFEIFVENYDKIERHNGKNLSYTLAVNEWADLTFSEFRRLKQGDPEQRRQMLLATDFGRNTTTSMSASTRTIPRRTFDESMLNGLAPADALDWRNQSVVAELKNQLSCTGADYAFAATCVIESANAIKKNHLTSLSEQQIIDCSQPQQNQGCHGGSVDNAFQYVIASGGLTSEYYYPFNSIEGICQQGMSTFATVKGIVDLKTGDEGALLAALNIGPVAVYVASNNEAFQFYSMGVLNDPSCGFDVDHAVAVVGYGTDPKTNRDYWIIRNDWGPGWGIQGYGYLIRNMNQCGIATTMSYPVV